MIGCHYLIYGKVQGVGYRAFTQSAARLLGLKGWARNLSDGRVEVLVLADQEKIDEFESALRRGPPHSRVDRLESVVYAQEVLQRELLEPDFLLLTDGENAWSAKT